MSKKQSMNKFYQDMEAMFDQIKNIDATEPNAMAVLAKAKIMADIHKGQLANLNMQLKLEDYEELPEKPVKQSEMFLIKRAKSGG